MKSVTASEAKQNFGEVLAQAEIEPVRIFRHGKAVAALVPSAWLDQKTLAKDPRIAAREEHDARDRAREDKHRRIALALLTATAQERAAMIQQAERVVDRWQTEQLCSPDYVQGWRTWLSLPTMELVKAMTCNDDPWARPMRQNSPFVGAV